MRVVVFGATGNVGTSLVRSLAEDARVREVVGVARRLPGRFDLPKTSWRQADITTDPLAPLLRGADAVVHLAWEIQPSRDLEQLHRTNVEGSRRVFEAAAQAGAGALIYASSIGAYSPGPKDRPVDESWPTGGIPSAWYSRHKVATERILDEVEAVHPDLRVVRLRPALIFKGEAASEIRRLFAGPFLPSPLVRPGLLKVIPRIPGLRLQALHADDVARAYHLVAVEEKARGAYNAAADPVLDPELIARELGAMTVPLPARAARILADATWRARLQPTPPGWLDMGLQTPLLDSTRLRTELGWEPQHSSISALRELLDAMSRGDGGDTPPLDPGAGGPARSQEVLSGVGGSNP